MIQLTAMVEGRPCIMLTDSTIEDAADSCRSRFGARFDGFAPVPVEIIARSKWGEYQAKQITRAELEEWLAGQDNEAEIRALFNGYRG